MNGSLVHIQVQQTSIHRADWRQAHRPPPTLISRESGRSHLLSGFPVTRRPGSGPSCWATGRVTRYGPLVPIAALAPMLAMTSASVGTAPWRRRITSAIRPVQPVWCEAPRPAPLSP